MSGYDGTIKIDTSINAKGVNTGVKRIAGAFGNILKSVKTIGAALAKAFSVGALVLFSASVAKIISTVRESMGELLKRSGSKTVAAVEDIQNRFKELKLAVANAFLPLVIAALPYIKMVISWLITMLNKISMITAAFLGQTHVLQVIEGSTKTVADNMETTTEQAKKALGALAGFDQINVLDTQQMDTPTAGGPDLTDAVTTATELVPITDSILSKVAEIKTWILDMWNTMKTAGVDAWNWVTEKWNLFSSWFTEHIAVPVKNIFKAIWETFAAGVTVIIAIAKSLWDTFVAGVIVTGQILSSLWDLFKLGAAQIVDWMSSAWDLISAGASAAWEIIVNAWGNAGAWFTALWQSVAEWASRTWENIGMFAVAAWDEVRRVWQIVSEWFKSYVVDPIRNSFINVWDYIGQTASNAWLKISEIWSEVTAWFSENILNPLVKVFSNAWNAIGDMASDAWTGIQDVFSAIGNWLRDNVGDPIQNTFETALDWVQEKWSSVFDAIGEFVKGIINNIIGALNGLLEGAVIGINGLIDGANLMGSIVPGWTNIPSVGAPQIPYLATGAVIPPNSQFLAVMGDQKSGRNIEAPEALIRQIVREESGGNGGQTITIRFEGTMAQFVRELKPYMDKENARIGGSLLKGS